MTPRSFFIVAFVLVAFTLVIGLYTAGGPGAARKDMFDQRRYQDLAAISRALACENLRIANPVLPSELDLDSIRSYCSGVAIKAETLLDNETGKPYTYVLKSRNEYAVCAEFYDAQKAMRQRTYFPGLIASFDPETGCVTGRIR